MVTHDPFVMLIISFESCGVKLHARMHTHIHTDGTHTHTPNAVQGRVRKVSLPEAGLTMYQKPLGRPKAGYASRMFHRKMLMSTLDDLASILKNHPRAKVVHTKWMCNELIGI